MFVWIFCQIVAFERILLEIKKLDVIQLKKLIQRHRPILLLGREIPSELVPAVEHASDSATLREVGSYRTGLESLLELHLSVRLLKNVNSFLKEVAVDISEHVIAEKHTVADCPVSGFLR